MRIALEIARAFRYAGEPWSAAELADALRVPVRTVRDVLVPLQQARIVSRVEEEHKQDAFQLGRSADHIRVTDVLGALRGVREPLAGDEAVTAAVEALLAELQEGEVKAAAGRTLGELLDQLPDGHGDPRDS